PTYAAASAWISGIRRTVSGVFALGRPPCAPIGVDFFSQPREWPLHRNHARLRAHGFYGLHQQWDPLTQPILLRGPRAIGHSYPCCRQMDEGFDDHRIGDVHAIPGYQEVYIMHSRNCDVRSVSGAFCGIRPEARMAAASSRTFEVMSSRENGCSTLN